MSLFLKIITSVVEAFIETLDDISLKCRPMPNNHPCVAAFTKWTKWCRRFENSSFMGLNTWKSHHKGLFASIHSFTQAVISEFVAVDSQSFLALSIINICSSVLKHVTSLLDSLTWHGIFIKNIMQLSINFTAVTLFHPQKMHHWTHFQFGRYLQQSRHVYDWLSEKLKFPHKSLYVSW